MKLPDYVIHESIEAARGCGYRKEGGLYLVSGEMELHGCRKLPLPLEVCSTCGLGIKPFRGFGWVNAAEMFKGSLDCIPGCVIEPPPERAGLIWIGEKFYTADAFTLEAMRQGVSRRIKSVPKGLEIGKTVILVAHRQAPLGKDRTGPAVFGAFVPRAIEYIVKPDDSNEKLQRLADRGIRLVRVTRDIDLQMPLFENQEEMIV